MRYIELNPVRANMVKHPADYPWSSYQANGQGKLNTLIDPHPLYLALAVTAEQRQAAYRKLFQCQLDNDVLDDIRESLNHELVFGRSYFKDKIEQISNRQTRMGQPGRPKVEDEPAVYWVGY